MTLQRLIVMGGLTIALIGCGSSGTSDAPRADTAPAAAAPATTAEVPERLRSAIATTLKVDPGKVTPNASFTKDLGADELAMVELVMAYEREFKVDIRDADAKSFQQVSDVVSFLRQRSVLR